MKTLTNIRKLWEIQGAESYESPLSLCILVKTRLELVITMIPSLQIPISSIYLQNRSL